MRREDIKKYFYILPKEGEKEGFEYFQETNSNMIERDFQLGIKYQVGEKTHFLMIGSNSYFDQPAELAFGSVENGRCFFLKETFGEEQGIECFSFPQEVFRVGTSSLLGSKNRVQEIPEKINLLGECIQKGLECLEAFEGKISEIKIQEALEKQKKIGEKTPSYSIN